MYVAAAIFSLFLSISGPAAGGSAVTSPSWCFSERHMGSSEEMTDFELSPVRVDRAGQAIRRLRDRTVIELGREEAMSLLSRPFASSTGRFYLARASIITTRNARLSDIYGAAGEPTRFALHWSRDDQSALLFSWQTVRGERQDYNVGVIVRTRLPIRHVYVGCWAVD
jgi:hypothetical protein